MRCLSGGGVDANGGGVYGDENTDSAVENEGIEAVQSTGAIVVRPDQRSGLSYDRARLV